MLVLLLLGILGWVAYRTIFTATPAQPVAEEDLLEAPDLDSMAQVADYTGDKELPQPDTVAVVEPISADDHVFGSISAPMSIIEYSNFGNRYAALFHPELRNIVEQSSGEIQWVYRHYPLSEADFTPGEGSECVFRQLGNDGFWAYFDAAFSQADRSIAALGNVAAGAGADRGAFETCMNDRLGRMRVVSQAQGAALDANVTISPTYVIRNNVTGEVRISTGLNTADYVMATVDAMR